MVVFPFFKIEIASDLEAFDVQFPTAKSLSVVLQFIASHAGDVA